MINTSDLFTSEACLELLKSIQSRTSGLSLVNYVKEINVEYNRVAVPIGKGGYEAIWGGEVITDIKNSKIATDNISLELKKLYISIPCSLDYLSAYGNSAISDIEKNVAAAIIKEENNVIVNGASDGKSPSGLIRNTTCPTVEYADLNELIINMFATEAVGINENRSKYLWITTNKMLKQILINGSEPDNEFVRISKDQCLMGIPVKIIEKIDSDKVDIILVNLSANYVLFVKNNGEIQMTQTTKATYVELFFYKSMAGTSYSDKGMVFGKLKES